MPIRSPEQAWRDAGRLARLNAINSALTVIGAAAAFIGGVYARSPLLMYVAPLAWLLLLRVLRWRCYLRILDEVLANRSAVCWQCWYPLTDVEPGRCPECGTPSTARRSAWPGPKSSTAAEPTAPPTTGPAGAGHPPRPARPDLAQV